MIREKQLPERESQRKIIVRHILAYNKCWTAKDICRMPMKRLQKMTHPLSRAFYGIENTNEYKI